MIGKRDGARSGETATEGEVVVCALDVLNNALRLVCWFATIRRVWCQLCGSEVDGRHYTGGCVAYGEVLSFARSTGVDVQEEEAWWLSWIWASGRGETLEECFKRLFAVS